ncbi:MAG: dihydroorotase [Puniceicoccaceae bacterium]
MNSVSVLQNARIIDPQPGIDRTGDLLIRDRFIVDSLTSAELESATVYDLQGKVVTPGLVDIHVHFREPGQTHKESIRSGSRAAAAGGFTSVVCMPNTSPVCDTPGTIQQILHAAERDSIIRIYPTGCLTRGMNGEEMAPIGSLARAGVVAVTDDGRCVQSNEIMRQVVIYANMFNLPVMDHCQDYSLTREATVNEGDWSLRLGLKGWPREAEEIIVARNIIIARTTGAQIHMQHISCKEAVDAIRQAKASGIRVTAEASPHHLSLTDACIKNYDTIFKMNPPLRTEEDQLAIIEGLRDGTLDCIATDHAPHAGFEKDVEFDQAPFGVIGLETALAVSLTELYHRRGFKLGQVVDLLSSAGARVARLPHGTLTPGSLADVTVVDPEKIWRVDPAKFHSLSRNCPWNGEELRGKVEMTFFEGRLVFDQDQIVEE